MSKECYAKFQATYDDNDLNYSIDSKSEEKKWTDWGIYLFFRIIYMYQYENSKNN